MKGETVHAIFAEIKQQRANQYQGGLQRDDANQPEQHFSRHCRQQRRDTAMTTEYEKHWRSLSGIRRRAIPRLSNDMFNSSSQSRVFRLLPQTTRGWRWLAGRARTAPPDQQEILLNGKSCIRCKL
jgi:hypothetical protein